MRTQNADGSITEECPKCHGAVENNGNLKGACDECGGSGVRVIVLAPTTPQGIAVGNAEPYACFSKTKEDFK